jgi:hypothetical protein
MEEINLIRGGYGIMNKCPCKECITLAICINREELKCSLLLKYLNETYINSVYPMSSKILNNMSEILRGSWGLMGVNNSIHTVRRNLRAS